MFWLGKPGVGGARAVQGLRALDAGRRGARRQEPKPSYSRHTMQTAGHGVLLGGGPYALARANRGDTSRRRRRSAGGPFLLYKASGTLKPRGGHTRSARSGGRRSRKQPRGQAAHRAMHRHRPALLRGGRVVWATESKKEREKKTRRRRQRGPVAWSPGGCSACGGKPPTWASRTNLPPSTFTSSMRGRLPLTSLYRS